MLVASRGIVIRNVKYADASIISKIYIRQLGIKTYIINGVHSPKAAIKPSILQPLTLLDIVVYNNRIKDIQRIKEARPSPVLESLHFDVIKSSIALFMAELIHKSIGEEEPNEALFDFLEKNILYLDGSTRNEPLLPLHFMLMLSFYLGFLPHKNWKEGYCFNLKEGRFIDTDFADNDSLKPELSQVLNLFLNTGLKNLHDFEIPKVSRQALLNKIITYYSYHLPGFQNLRSLDVLTNTLK